MKLVKFIIAVAALSLTAQVFAADKKAAAPAAAPAKEKLVVQVSDADPAKWNLALNNVKNVQEMVGGADKLDAEIVVYGPGINMLKLDSAVAARVEEAKKNGVAVVACQNTMKNLKLTEADMLPNTSYVPAGVVEIMKKQKEGYAYVRP